MLDQVLEEAEDFLNSKKELPKSLYESKIERPVVIAVSQFKHFASAIVLHRDEEDDSLLYTGVLLISHEVDWIAQFSCGSNFPEEQESPDPIRDIHFCWTTDVPQFDTPSSGAHLIYGLVAPDVVGLRIGIGTKPPRAVDIQGPLRAFVMTNDGSNQEEIVITTERETGDHDEIRYPPRTPRKRPGAGRLRLKSRRRPMR